MPFYQVDSSALVKRYVAETGSAWMRSITPGQADDFVSIVRISIAEVASALARKQREGDIDQLERDAALATFLGDCRAAYEILEVDAALVDRAVALTQTHALRAYDAVQVAAALIVKERLVANGLTAPIFVSADDRLCGVSAAERLQVDNPSAHP